MKVAVVGTGNVGVAIATDLSIKGHEVSLLKTSDYRSDIFNKFVANSNRAYLKEKGEYTSTTIQSVSKDLSLISEAEVVFVTIQSNYHEDLLKIISQYINEEQIFVVICSYMSSFFFYKYCMQMPMIAETTGPYLEGRVEMQDSHQDGVVFRVGCRLERSPLSVFYENRADECMKKIKSLYSGFSNDYSVSQSALLNPNMVLHTVGAIMSIPRIEFSDGNFCMYREAYSRKNGATINLMLHLDEEKCAVLNALRQKPADIFKAGGFSRRMDSFYDYSESSDRAISPTSIRSRYITEDVSQGLVLLESIAKQVGVHTPIATSLIEISSKALGVDFRAIGRTVERLGIENYIRYLSHAKRRHKV